jgi:myo-inositol 2-dehydrogenase/D-chiro-inositol 1-dehydrogenase
VRIGVVGVGRIGRMHAELLAREVPGVQLTCVHDPLPIDGDLPAPAVGLDELLSTVDAVAICSSTPTHADLIVAAAEAGKAIFCEKPVSLDLAELDRALAAVKAAGVPFQIGFNRRFDPAHAAVANADVGELQLVRISSRDPAPPPLDYIKSSGGIFLDMTIHDFDMARYVAHSEVVEVFARGAVRVDPAIGEAGDVDTAVVLLEHENGCLTTIDNSRQAVYGYDQRVEAFGSAGVAVSENPQPMPHFFLDRYIPSYLAEWEAFVHAVTSGTPPFVGPEYARAPLVIGLAAWRSLREGRPVRL